MWGAQPVRHVCLKVESGKCSNPAATHTFRCCLFKLDGSICALAVGAGKIQGLWVCAPHLQNRSHVLREWDSPARVVCFSVRYLNHAALDVLPTQTEALFGSVPAVQQYGDNIAQQERIGRLDWSLTSLGRPYSRPRTLIRLQQGVTQRLRGV